MSRVTWVLGGLLVLTNAWWLLRPERAAPASPGVAGRDEMTRRDAEIGRLRAALSESRRRRHANDEAPAAPAPRPAPAARPAPAPQQAATTAVSAPSLQQDEFRRARQLGETWREALLQTVDVPKRHAAFAEVRQAFHTDEIARVLAALQTAAYTTQVSVDRTGLRADLLPHTDSLYEAIRDAAWQALASNKLVEPPDLEKLRAHVERGKGNRGLALIALLGAEQGVVEGATAELVLRLLGDRARERETVWALHQARKLSEEVVAKLVEYARRGREESEHARHFVLRSLGDKPRAVVDLLLDNAESGNAQALEGLRWGVRSADAAYTAERLRRLFDARTDMFVRSQAVAAIGHTGDPASRAWLTALAEDANADAAIRNAAREALQSLDRAQR